MLYNMQSGEQPIINHPTFAAVILKTIFLP